MTISITMAGSYGVTSPSVLPCAAGSLRVRRLPRLLLYPRRQDELAGSLVLRPHHRPLSVLLPLDHHRHDEAGSVLHVVVLVEHEPAAGNRHVGLLELLDDGIGLRGLGAGHRSSVDLDGIIGAAGSVDRLLAAARHEHGPQRHG